jgi:hypothetical protein
MVHPSAILEKIAIELAEPSEKFAGWLEERFPEWRMRSIFCSCVPKEHTRLAIEDRTWGYLWKAERIMLNAEKIHCPGCLGIGSTAGGSWLVLDTSEQDDLMLGCFDLKSLLEAEECKGFMDRGKFHPFELSFGRWLELADEDPRRRDIPN